MFAAAPSLKSESLTSSGADDSAAKEFLGKWERAWNNHDAHQLVLLHTPNANTINRFGTLVQGREALEKALGFLHNVGGRYHDITAPPLHLIDLRQIAPNVMILQASWKSLGGGPPTEVMKEIADNHLISFSCRRSVVAKNSCALIEPVSARK